MKNIFDDESSFYSIPSNEFLGYNLKRRFSEEAFGMGIVNSGKRNAKQMIKMVPNFKCTCHQKQRFEEENV